jgi:hypothetical protein
VRGRLISVRRLVGWRQHPSRVEKHDVLLLPQGREDLSPRLRGRQLTVPRSTPKMDDRIGHRLCTRALENQVADLEAATLRVTPVLWDGERATRNVTESLPGIVAALDEKGAVVWGERDCREIRGGDDILSSRCPVEWPRTTQNEREPEQEKECAAGSSTWSRELYHAPPYRWSVDRTPPEAPQPLVG